MRPRRISLRASATAFCNSFGWAFLASGMDARTTARNWASASVGIMEEWSEFLHEQSMRYDPMYMQGRNCHEISQ